MIKPERIRGRVIAIAVVLTLGTLLLSFLPALRFTYRAPAAAAVGLGTAHGLIAGLTAYLVFGRYRRTHASRDLLFLTALALFAFNNLVFSALPKAIHGLQTQPFALWAPVLGRALAAATLAAAAIWPPRRLERPGRAGLIAGASALASVLACAALIGILSPNLPVGMELDLSLIDLGRPRVTGPWLLVLVRALTVALLLLAVAGFLRRAERKADELMSWVALATPVAAFAAIHQLLFPGAFPDSIHTADVLRLAFYLLLLMGTLQEINAAWEQASLRAVLDERRRLSRNLHDGLAQELAFIVAKVSEIGPSVEHRAIRQIASAADRALGDSRRAIEALSRTTEETLDVALTQTAEEMTSRVGTRLVLDVARDVRVAPEVREELLRIAREAISNATRHGNATTVGVALSDGDNVRLAVSDDGVGFDLASAGTDGTSFGLINMRERAEALGAELRVSTQPGEGTEVEVVLPSRSES